MHMPGTDSTRQHDGMLIEPNIIMHNACKTQLALRGRTPTILFKIIQALNVIDLVSRFSEEGTLHASEEKTIVEANIPQLRFTTRDNVVACRESSVLFMPPRPTNDRYPDRQGH